MSSDPKSLAYLLGRKSAPLLFKVNWVFTALAGREEEKLKAEYQMGYMLAQAYEQNTPAHSNQRLSALAGRLTKCLRNKTRTHTFKLDQTAQPNALAFPGGFIYVSEKLIDLCGEDEDAIAFVLAHEIAHVIQGDANKRFLTRTAISGLLRWKARGINPALKQLLAKLVQQGYSREQEFQADRFAIALVKAAKFDPDGGCRLFSRLKECGGASNPLTTYFSSHPDLDQRIRKIKLQMKGA